MARRVARAVDRWLMGLLVPASAVACPPAVRRRRVWRALPGWLRITSCVEARPMRSTHRRARLGALEQDMAAVKVRLDQATCIDESEGES